MVPHQHNFMVGLGQWKGAAAKKWKFCILAIKMFALLW